MHLMQMALQTLKSKGIKISEKENKAALIAIFFMISDMVLFRMHLRIQLLPGVNHEMISEVFMQKLNETFSDELLA